MKQVKSVQTDKDSMSEVGGGENVLGAQGKEKLKGGKAEKLKG